MSDDILDYADLVARYESGLIENLRSFGFQTEYLDLWVPDEDLSRSLLNLFDAAAEVGHGALALRIPVDAVAGLERAGFPGLAAQRGRFSMEPGPGGAILRISDLRVVAEPSTAAHDSLPSRRMADAAAARPEPQICADEAFHQPLTLSEPYATHLAAAGKCVPVRPVGVGLVQACAGIDGLILEAAIDPKDHVICGMTVTGARGKTFGDLLSVLAHICRGLPVLEAADHGAIRLEYLLRGDAPRPRPGIVIPEMVDPAFRFVSAILRALLANYRQKTGFRDSANIFDVLPGPHWMQADEAGRRAQLAEAIARSGFVPEDVTVVAIEYDVRVVVSLGPALTINSAHALAALERHIKQHVDGRLELFLSDVTDSNKLRRLSEQKGDAP